MSKARWYRAALNSTSKARWYRGELSGGISSKARWYRAALSGASAVRGWLWTGTGWMPRTAKYVTPADLPWVAPAAVVAGAAALGSTSYPIPTSNAVYLSTTGSDSASGTVAAPKATLAGALAAISAGGTIVARGGTYLDAFGEGAITKSFTLQSYPGEAVWFDGSVVLTGWTYDTAAGKWWAPSTTEWDHSDPSGIAGTLNPLALWRDLLFRDGGRLFQVSYPPAAGQFSVDYDTDRVWVGDDPTGHEIRITTKARFALIQGPDTTLRGIGVRRYTTPSWGGSVQVVDAAKRTRIEHCHLYDISSLAIDSDNAVITRNTVSRGNTIGLGGNVGSDCEWSANLVEGSNQKLLQNHVPSAMKITKHTRPIIKDNVFRDTLYGMGIWLDVSCYQPVITGNLIRNSAGNTTTSGNGIWVELTEGGLIANNRCYGVGDNAKYGLASYNSGGQIWINNYVEGYRLGGIFLGGDTRRNTSVSGDGIDWSLIPWYDHDIQIINNVLGQNTLYFQLLTGADGLTTQAMVTRIEGNLSCSRPAGASVHDALVGWVATVGASRTIYTTWAAAATAWPGLGLANNRLTGNVPPTTGDATTAAATAVPLDTTTATALGVPLGYQAVGPILPAPVTTT
jgi:hypothetical protein